MSRYWTGYFTSEDSIMDVFVSNGGFNGTCVRDSVTSLINGGIENIELSSGYVTSEDLNFLKLLIERKKIPIT